MYASTDCIGIGGVRVDRAVAAQLLEVVAPYAVEGSIQAEEKISHQSDDVRRALARELDEARYESHLASRRHESVDPDKRLVASELERRWETALQRVKKLEERIAQTDTDTAARPMVDREALLRLAQDLPRAWNSSSVSTRTKQRIVRVVIHERPSTAPDACRAWWYRTVLSLTPSKRAISRPL